MFKKVLYIAGGLFLIIAIAAAVGLGFWAYRLNSQLEQANADYQALKSDYDSLSAEYSQAQADFDAKSTQADADLSDALAQVTTLESEVKKLESQNNQLRIRMAEIQDNVAMLSDFWFTSESNFERKVNASDDDELKKLYTNLQESDAFEDYIELMSYMIQSIDDVSKVSWLPVEEVNALSTTGVTR